MGFVEEMKWWHWMLISLVIGAAFAFTHQDVEAPVKARGFEPVELEKRLMMKPATFNGKSIRWVSNIWVYPPTRSKLTGRMCQMITCESFDPKSPPRKGESAPEYVTIVEVPFSPTGSRNFVGPITPKSVYPGTNVYVAKAGDTIETIAKSQYGENTSEARNLIAYANERLSGYHVEGMAAVNAQIRPGGCYFIPWSAKENHTFQDFLDQAARNSPWVKYRFAWWHIPRYVYPFWMGSSFVLIGLIWPAIIRILAGGGLGRQKIDGGDFKLSKYKASAAAKPAASAASVTAADLAKLEALEANLEASLKKSGAFAPPVVEAAKPEAAPVRKLAAAPVEAPAPKKEEGPRKYTGTYYPVVRTAEKKK